MHTVLYHVLVVLSSSFQGKLYQAEPLLKRTQEIYEKYLGRDHPNVATILNNRAGLFQDQVRTVIDVPGTLVATGECVAPSNRR